MGQHAVNYSRDTINRQFLSGEHKLVLRSDTLASDDLSNAGLTLDGNYNDLDLTSYGVPVDAVAVLIKWKVRNSAPGKRFNLRENGVDGYRVLDVYTNVANMNVGGITIIGCVNGIIEYRFQDTNFTYYLTVYGWFV